MALSRRYLLQSLPKICIIQEHLFNICENPCNPR